MKTVEERLKEYEPLWENWTYTGEFLGEGAMSSVFEIQSTAMGMNEVAALKIITVKKNAHGEVKIPENALNEIKILRTLSGSSNIVNYHDSTQRNIYDDDGNLAEIDILIKMEKLEPLSEGSKLSEDNVVSLAKDMCTALMHASDHGIIHRDIKPQNIFVDAEGNYKLGDFGISKIVSGFSDHYTMNIGTLAYTAPEVAGSIGGRYDISSDIYSLGLVLYAFLNNGYLPFVNSMTSLHDAITKRLSGAAFPSPSNGTKALKSIVMRACSNDRVKRFKNPREMLDALDLLSSGGKKMVVDPFATLDANLDAVDDGYSIAGSGTSGVKFSGSSGTMATSYSKGASSGGLKINMSKPSEIKPAPSTPPATPPKKKGTLTIRMDKSTPSPEDTPKTTPEIKPAEVKPAEAKPAEVKPAEAKPAEAKPAEAKPAEAKPAEAKPAEAKPAEAKPAEAKPAEAKPAEVKPAEVKPAEVKPAEVNPIETPKKSTFAGGLRINMGGQTTIPGGETASTAKPPKPVDPPKAPMTPKPDTATGAEEKPKSGTSFFSAPKSL